MEQEIWQLYQRRADEHFRNKLFDQAIVEYKMALKHNPQLFEARLNLSALYLLKENYPEAKNILEGLVSENREHPAVYFNLAKINLQHNQPHSAAVNFEKALLHDPGNPLTLKMLAFVHFTNGEKGKAWDILTELDPEHGPLDPDIPYYLGRLALENKDLPAAIDYLTRATKGRGNHFESLYFLADAFSQSGDFSKALRTVKQARLIDRTEVRAHKLLIDLLLKTGEVEQAISEVNQLKAVDQSKETQELEKKAATFYQFYLCESGDLFYPDWSSESPEGGTVPKESIPLEIQNWLKKGELTLALTTLEARCLEGQKPLDYLEWAYILRVAGFFENSIILHEKFIDLTRENYRYHYNYIISLIQCRGDLISHNELEILIKNFPNQDPPLNYLKGLLSLRNLNFSEALIHFEKFPEDKPGSPEILYERGLIYYLTHEMGKAVQVTKKALNLSPKNIRFFRRLALFYACEGQFQELNLLLKQYQFTFENHIFYQDLKLTESLYSNPEDEKIFREIAQNIIEMPAHGPIELSLQTRAALFVKNVTQKRKIIQTMEKLHLLPNEVLFQLALYHLYSRNDGKYSRFWTRFWTEPHFHLPWESIPFLNLTLGESKKNQLLEEIKKFHKIFLHSDPYGGKKIQLFAGLLGRSDRV